MQFSHARKEWPGSMEVLRLIAIAMLFWALAQNPHVYYQILRWIVCIVSGLLAFRAYKQGRQWWAWVFAIIVLLYNPIDPFAFRGEIWRAINVTSGIILAGSIPIRLHK